MASATAIFLSKLAALFLSCAVMSALACSPLPPTDSSNPDQESNQGEISKKVDVSQIVALGKVISSKPDEERNKQGWNVSTVEFEVYCAFKGGPLRQIVRIENVGYIPGLCITKILKEDEIYLVYLTDNKEGTYAPVDIAPDNVPEDQEEAYIDEVNGCGIETTFPTDVDEDKRKSQCRGSADTFPVSLACPETSSPKITTSATTPKEVQEEADVSAGSAPEVEKDNNIETAQVVGGSDKKDKNSASSKCISAFGVISLVLAYFIL